MDDFEKKLSRQPLRHISAEWRTEILAVCRGSKLERRAQKQFWLSTLNHKLSTLFWPHPKAWAGLAATWVFIIAVNVSLREPASRVAEKSAPPSPEVVAQLKQQNLLFAELMGSRETPDADRQKIFVPKPRGETKEVLMT